MRLMPYPEYSATNIPGLEQLPAHWEVKKLKLIAEVRGGVAKGKDLTGQDTLRVPYLRVANVQDGFLNLDEVEEIDIPERELDRYLLQPGDVLMNEGGDFDKLGRGCVWRGEISPCIHQNHVFSVRPHRVRSEWLNTVSGSAYAQFFFMGRAKQSTNLASISAKNVSELPVVMPPTEEQDRMLAFLNRETAKIDTLIAEQQNFIDKLKEKREATVVSAVTKGVVAGRKMRQSGQDWIGEVPSHWEVVRIKWVAQMESGHTPDKKNPTYWADCNIQWVSLNDTGYLKANDFISETAFQISELGMANSSARLLPAQTVVFSRDATIGRCAITTIPMAVSQHFIGWVCGPRILPEFLLRVLRSMTQELDRLTFGATLKTIGMPDVRSLVTPLPPIQEQEAIICHIRKVTTGIDSLVKESEASIALLQEHRSALITAVVTGKVDVRSDAKESA